MSEPRKTILFVDDEANILAGLGRMLRGLRQSMDLQFAASGEQALAVLAAQPVDVFVTDMRMPGMDGATLLGLVQERYPQVIRIMLSGQADRDSVLRTVVTVHQFLTKPTTPETLKEVLTRACALQDLLADAQLKALISRLGSLPSLPALYAELQRRLQDPDCALNDVARVIEQDLGMCAKVLQLVNSSFFGLPRTIDSPARAVSLLGLDLVRALVLSAGVFTELRPVGRQVLRVEELQAHSLDVARCARLIATAESGHKEVADNACIAGMVHDAGKLLLAASLPGEYADVLGLAREQGQACWQAERQVLAADHGLVGGYLLGLWGLPGPVVEAVTLHHRLEDDPEPSFSPALAVHAADALCHQLRPGTDGLARPELNTALLERAGLLDRVDRWLALCAGAEA